MNICIIPARGGSKRIPYKNIKNFCGKPIIAYSIQNAQKSQIFDRIIVSTDDKKIAQIAKKYGAEVPFLRPKHLSTDTTPTIPVIAHCIQELKIPKSSIVCCLYPTAPLIDSHHITYAFETLKNNPDKHYIFYATPFEKNPYRSFTIQNNKITLLFPKYQNTRTQDLIPVYNDAGVLYFGKASNFLNQKEIFTPKSNALILQPDLSQDIDTKSDWQEAEKKYYAKKEK